MATKLPATKKRPTKPHLRHVESREILLKYLANPDNKRITRTQMATELLGFKHQESLYQAFTTSELNEIEKEALDIRRQAYAPDLARVDRGLLERAATGDPAAAKLAYQKFEGWSEKTKNEVMFTGPMITQILSVFPSEVAEKIKAALIAQQQEVIDV